MCVSVRPIIMHYKKHIIIIHIIHDGASEEDVCSVDNSQKRDTLAYMHSTHSCQLPIKTKSEEGKAIKQ